MNRRALIGACAATLAVAACGEPADATGDPTAATAIFDTVWRVFDREYPSFAIRGVDWDALRQLHRPQLAPDSDDDALFEVLSDLLLALRDGHVALIAPAGTTLYHGWYRPYPRNFEASLIPNYVSGGVPGLPFTNGVTAEGLGYVHFEDLLGPQLGAAFDEYLNAMGELPGLIIDLRNNSGGSDFEVHDVVGRLIATPREYRMVRYRDGPEWDDFGPWLRGGVSPAGGAAFDGPIAVLTNRLVFSSAESMILALRTRRRVTVVGDTTGGGSANPRWLSLPRGFVVRVPQWQEADLDGVNYEGTGIAPDERAAITDDDIAEGRDPIIERAISVLRGVP